MLCFRVLLYEISEELGTKDLESLKFYARNEFGLSKKQMDGISSGLDLFNVLEREGTLHPPDVTELQNLLQAIGDEELMELVEKYKTEHPPGLYNTFLLQTNF